MLIVDTAGRLHIDDELMGQLAEIKKRIKPHDVLLVVDAMTGQDAVNVAEQFAEATEFDGVVMSKLDGDARGGAALSVKAVTGKPILYASTGEKLDQLERFHPDRMAQRILGMGDVLSLIEKAEKEMDAADAEELERKMRQDQFTLDDFLKQLKQVRKMGPLTSVLGMMPGMGKAMKELRSANVDDRELDRLEAMILSMTAEERANPDVIRGSRRRRIAAGLGHERPGRQAADQAVRPDAQDDEADGLRQDAEPGGDDPRAARRRPPPMMATAERPRSVTCAAVTWQYESDSDERAPPRTRSGASSSPTSAPRATAARSRRSAATTRRPSLPR